MKYILIALVGLASIINPSSLKAQVQQNATAPSVDPNAPYMKDKHIPAFSITSIDGKEITNKQLPTKYKYTCIIIFSPDCSHCEHEASEISKNADKFKDVLFVWDSYREMDLIKKFATKYNLAGQPNVVIGRDPAFSIPTFFRPKMTPFVALYNNGNLVRIWDQGAEVNELIKIIQGN
jgi:hypothetical protein